MKTLYLDCGMGAAGDMLTAALVELLPDPAAFVQEMNQLGIPGMHMTLEPAVKCGITGSHISVTIHGEEEESHDVHAHPHEHKHDHDHPHEHHHGHGHEHGHHHVHSSLHDIAHIVEDHLALPEKVRADVMAVYGLIAEAESNAHGIPVTEIHFHEVGTLDAITDVVAVSLLMDRLAPDEVVVSPIHVGSGQVHCAHGILPVPAPATAHILRSVPIYGGSIQGELCTPTGAALLKHFATRFGDMPVMCTQSIGYGMGTKDFPAANCVRAMLGTTSTQNDQVMQLSCNVDDMTGEQIGFACEQLFEAGALDVYTIPIGMKKSRPGTLICALCHESVREAVAIQMFRHTTTLGIRAATMQRYVLSRTTEEIATPYGLVHRKVAHGYGAEHSKYEYEDLAAIARAQNCSISDVLTHLNQQA